MNNSKQKTKRLKRNTLLLLITSTINVVLATLIALKVIPYQATIGFIPMYFYMGVLTHKVFKSK
tara:strand:- start:550 stop:741 length:192 start_codon:yes stop_codon:yes gene_type:complete